MEPQTCRLGALGGIGVQISTAPPFLFLVAAACRRSSSSLNLAEDASKPVRDPWKLAFTPFCLVCASHPCLDTITGDIVFVCESFVRLQRLRSSPIDD